MDTPVNPMHFYLWPKRHPNRQGTNRQGWFPRFQKKIGKNEFQRKHVIFRDFGWEKQEKQRKAAKVSCFPVFGWNFAMFSSLFLLFQPKSGKITFLLKIRIFSELFQFVSDFFKSVFQVFLVFFVFFSRDVFKSKNKEITQKKREIKYFQDLALWLRWIFTMVEIGCA